MPETIIYSGGSAYYYDTEEKKLKSIGLKEMLSHFKDAEGCPAEIVPQIIEGLTAAGGESAKTNALEA